MANAQVPAPVLRCVQTLPNGDVQLTWEWIPGTCGTARIYASTSPSGPFFLLATVNAPATTFIHTGANGNNQIWYYYLTEDPSCGTPLIPSDTLDNREPDPPGLIRASVESSGQVRVEWNSSSEPEAYGYIVYVYDAGFGNFVPLDTVAHPQTFYLHTSTHPIRPVMASTQPETYSIAVMDSCQNTGPLQTRVHTTIFLQGEWNLCQNLLLLTWTHYRGWQPQYYVVEYWTPGSGLWLPYDTVFYPDSVWRVRPWLTDSLCLRVRAETYLNNQKIVARSNPFCTRILQTGTPPAFYLRRVTVVGDTFVWIEWWIDTPYPGKYFRVWREQLEPVTSSPQVIAYVPFPGSGPPYVVIDSFVHPLKGRYRYTVDLVDTCNVARPAIRYGIPIYLKVRPSEAGTQHIQWTPYERWAGTCRERILYRSADGGPVQAVATLPCTETSYVDNIRSVPLSVGYFCYQVCEWEDANPYGHAGLYSCSPTTCVYQDVIIHMPNAFAPDREPPLRPFLRYEGQILQYEYRILNRAGTVLFHTDNPFQGWDGTFQGKPVPQGVYFYHVRFHTPEGRELERLGYFFLIRSP